MRKLKYYVACTVDRFIAGKNDSFEFFLTKKNTLLIGFKTFLKQFRLTFEIRLASYLESEL